MRTVLGTLMSLGLASSATAAPLPRVTLSAARLAPELGQVKTAPGQPFALYVAPVQLGSFLAPAADKSAKVTSVRVPQEGTPGVSQTVDPNVEPMHVEEQFSTRFDRRTVTLAPFAAFWVAIGNSGDAPLTIDPKMFVLLAGGKRMKAFADGGELLGRFMLDLQALTSKTLGRPRGGSSTPQLHRQLGYLTEPFTIPPKKAWAGYVSFDVGAYTSDEYDAFLKKAGSIKIAFTPPKAAALEVAFDVEQASLTVVCLPKTPKPSFERCEVMPPVTPPAPVPAPAPGSP